MKDQIKFMCELNKISYTKEFIDYVYEKKLKSFSGGILKTLKEEFNKNK